jgi:hypothetical protein
MPARRKAKKRKAIKYKTLTITLTARQKKSLVNFCKSRKTTPAKVIKKAIKPLLDNYTDLRVNLSKEKVNQLELFHPEEVKS